MEDGWGDRLIFPVVLAGFSMPFLVTAIFELRTGYAWKNMAPGNRRVSRFEAPGKFARSVGFHLFTAAVLLGCALWRFFTS